MLWIELAHGAPPNLAEHLGMAFYLMSLHDVPRLAKKEDWSPEFIDSADQCLKDNPARRPTAAQLFSHPFFDRAYRIVDMMALQRYAATEKKRRRQHLRSHGENFKGRFFSA
jgi:serine/threonine protein kinase